MKKSRQVLRKKSASIPYAFALYLKVCGDSAYVALKFAQIIFVVPVFVQELQVLQYTK